MFYPMLAGVLLLPIIAFTFLADRLVRAQYRYPVSSAFVVSSLVFGIAFFALGEAGRVYVVAPSLERLGVAISAAAYAVIAPAILFIIFTSRTKSPVVRISGSILGGFVFVAMTGIYVFLYVGCVLTGSCL